MQAEWEQMPDEPAHWYARFEVYQRMGPNRTLNGVYRLIAQLEGRRGRRCTHGWRKAAQAWRWQARAQAWDAAEAAQAQAAVPGADLDPSARRRAMVDNLLAAVAAALQHAELSHMSREEARQALPTLRGLLRDLLAAQRSEADLLQAGEGVAPFTADELRLAQAELERWRAAQARIAAPLPPGQGGPAPPQSARLALRDALAALYPDEASARRIAAQAGLALGRIAFAASAVNNWHAIIQEAEHSGRMAALHAVVQAEYGADAAWQAALGAGN
jgi:hypothetical protein